MLSEFRLLEIDKIWACLDEVPDPEIPVISLVDLGVIREVYYEDTTLVVVVTPTYSGCPATKVINDSIEEALRKQGVSEICLKRQLSPPWTSAWMSEKGRNNLREYGIAPSVESSKDVLGCPVRRKPVVICPRCGSEQTEEVSRFGSTPCKASYRCVSCLEPFGYFKSI